MICHAQPLEERDPAIDQYSEFQQLLESKPPLYVHGTATLLFLLIGIAVVWAAFTQADLVVVSQGRIRPTSDPTKVFVASDTRLLGRVIEVGFSEGQVVRQGQVLIRLGTQLIDNEITRQKKVIQGARDDLDRIEHLDVLLRREYEAAQAKSKAQLQAARKRIESHQQRRDSDIHQARTEVVQTGKLLERYRRLAEKNAVSRVVLDDQATKHEQALERLRLAKLPVVAGEIDVLVRDQQMIESDYEVRLGELDARRVLKSGEIRKAQEELTSLRLRRNHAEIVAPDDGVIVAGKIHVGDVLESGKAIIEIAKVDGFHFEANVTSKQIGQLTVGQLARIKFTAFDHQEYGTATGKIVYVAPDSMLSRSTERLANDFGYSVRILLESEYVSKGDNTGELKLGMGGVAEIIAERKSLLNILRSTVRNSVSFG